MICYYGSQPQPAKDPPRIIDADTHQDEGQNLLQHGEGGAKQHGKAVARHAPEDHEVELRHAYDGNPRWKRL